VEIDVLTGAITILRGDIIYDCGKSMNPAVDLGQVCINIVHYVLNRSTITKSVIGNLEGVHDSPD
jgi:hypothetical protein